MAADPNATLPSGIGNAAQAQQATWFLRNQPWYQAWLKSKGLTPRGDAFGDVTLTDAQQEELLALARQKGIGISDHWEINQNGQIGEKGMGLGKKILIGAGIGGLALTGLGAAGIGPLAGLLGGGTTALGGGALAAGVDTSGLYGPLAGAYGLATTEATIPAALAALTPAELAAAAAGGGAAGGAAGGAGGAGGGGGVAVPPAVDQIKNKTAGMSDLEKMLIGYGIDSGSKLVGGILTNKANTDAANAAAEATKYAAQLQDEANRRAEIFSRQTAENQWLNSEAARKANYEQWAARENRISNLGVAMGMSARDIPAYAAGIDPQYTNQTDMDRLLAQLSANSSEGPGGITGKGQTVPISGPQVQNTKASMDALTNQFGSDAVTQALLKNYQSLGKTPTGVGTGPTDLAYFRDRINQTGGLTADNMAYWFGPNGRIAKELAGSVPAETSGGAGGATYQPTYFTYQDSPFQYTQLMQPNMNWMQQGNLAALARG